MNIRYPIYEGVYRILTLHRHASPDMNLNPENTTKMNPFIILLVQNATKCIFHTQES